MHDRLQCCRSKNEVGAYLFGQVSTPRAAWPRRAHCIGDTMPLPQPQQLRSYADEQRTLSLQISAGVTDSRRGW